MKALWRLADDRSVHLLVLLVVGIAILLPFHLQFTTLNTPDPYDYAQLARNLAEGKGFTTDVITPISWGTVPELDSHPDLWRAPLYPLAVAAFFQLFGTSPSVLPVVSSVAFLGFVLIVYRLGERLFDRRTGFLAGLFVTTAPGLLRTGVTGYTEALYMLLVFAAVLAVVRNDRHPCLLGALSGLAYLTRYNHWFLLAGILIFALSRLRRNRRGYGLKFCVTFFATLSPWLLRNVLVVGQPFYHHHAYLLASHNPINEGFSVFFQFDPPNLVDFAVRHPWVLIRKALDNLVKLYGWIPRFFRETWVLALLGAWGMVSLRDRREDGRGGLLVAFGLGFLLQAVILSFVHLKARHFVPFLPVVFLFGAAAVARVFRKGNRWLGGLLVGGVLLVNLLFVFAMNPWPSTVTEDEYRKLRDAVPAGEPILTNAPELTAWYTDRPSLWVVPFEEAEARYPEYDFVFLTGEVSRNYSRRTNLERDFLVNRAFHGTFRRVESVGSSRSRLYVRRR